MSDVIGTAKIVAELDSSGVEVGAAKGKRALADLGVSASKAGKQASDGIAVIGKGGDQAAQKVDAATRNMIGSIQRQIAAMEAGSKSGAEYYKILASQRGIDANVLKPYLDQLDAAKVKQDSFVSSLSKAPADTQGSALLARLRDQVATTGLGEEALLRYRAAQAGVGAEASHLITQLQNIKAATAAKAAEDIAAASAAKEEAAAIRSAAAAQQNFLASLRQQVATKGLDASGLLAYRAAQLGVSKEAEGLIAQLAKSDESLGKTGISAAQMANNLRMVGPQVTDIVTSLQAGQKPLTVFIQQGGQLKDVFGGIGPAAKALGGYVLGLVNPYTLAAAAAAGLAYAYSQGSKEGDAYAKAIILSGNAAGTTVSQLQDMAKRIDSVTGTQSEAAAALAQFAASGNIAGQSMERFAAIAVKAEDLTGQAVKETVKQFSELGKSPVEASIKLNESTNYLTASLYQQIKALEDQGKTADAAALAQKAYADTMDSRLQQLDGRLGTIERGWHSITDAAKEAWDSMLDIGRSQSTGDKLSSISSEIEAVQARLQRESGGGLLGNLLGKIDADKLAALKDAQAYTQENLRLENQSASAQKAAVDRTKERAKFDQDGVQFLTNQEKLKKAITAAETANQKLLKDGVITLKEYNDRIADITTKYKDKGAISAAIQLDKAKLGLDIDTIQKAQDQLASIYKNSEQILESVHAAGLISDKDYYESKREFIRLESDAQQEALQKELARYQQEKLTGKDKVDNDRKIADAQAKIATVRADISAKLEILSNQEAASAKRLQLSHLTARQAAQDYFDTLNRQQQRSLSGIGQGAQKRNFDSGVSQIEDRYAGQRRDLENQKAQLELEGKFTEDARAQYEQRLSIIDDFQKKSIASYAGYYGDLMKKQGDWSLGAQEGLNNYLDDARNVFKQTENLVGDAFGGMEDALVNFVRTGKLSFGDLANTILTDLARMEVKALETKLFSGLSSGGGLFGTIASLGLSFFGGGMLNDVNGAGLTTGGPGLADLGLGGGRAAGGPVDSGTLYRVNERGPELLTVGGSDFLMMGSQSGKVTPNHELGGRSAQITYAPVINIDSRTDRAQIQQDVQRQIQVGHAQLVDQLQRARVL